MIGGIDFDRIEYLIDIQNGVFIIISVLFKTKLKFRSRRLISKNNTHITINILKTSKNAYSGLPQLPILIHWELIPYLMEPD